MIKTKIKKAENNLFYNSLNLKQTLLMLFNPLTYHIILKTIKERKENNEKIINKVSKEEIEEIKKEIDYNTTPLFYPDKTTTSTTTTTTEVVDSNDNLLNRVVNFNS